MPTILQITDTHLSPRNGLFLENIATLRRAAQALQPEVIVFSGDLSLDGADREEDMAFAAEQLKTFPGQHIYLPGNHDVGSHPFSMPHQPVDAARMERFRRHFGPGRAVLDLAGWRVVALNTEVMATGLEEEAAQAVMIAEAARDLGDRRLAVFLHKPLFVTRRNDPAPDIWSVMPEARAALAPLLDSPALRLLATGHLHLFRETRIGRAACVWAPSVSFVMKPESQDNIPGDRRCGAVLHILAGDAATSQMVVPQGFVTTDIADVQHLTYPRGPA
jgi:alkaline phosphatase D